MLDLSKYVVDTSDWDSLAIINPENGDEIAYFSVGDSDVFSFAYIDNHMYISEPGLSHYSAVWNYFCEKNGLHPKNQKKYDINEIDKICDDIRSDKVKCDGRFYKGYNIIQILSCDNPNITKDKIIFDICNNFGVSRNECYLLQEKPTNIGFETRIEKLQEEKNYYFTQKQIDLFESKQVINESSRDNLLLPYLELVQKIEPNITLGQLKNYLMKKFVTEGNIHALSLGSNFYLSGVARYYFNGDLTTNKKLNIFYPNVTDEFIVDVCQRLDEIIIYLRNSYIDTTGTKWLQPEDFGTLSIAKLFRKYGGIIDKLKAKQDKYKTNTEDKYNNVSNKIGNNYTYDIIYDYEDCRKYNSATSPGAWCITYGKQHYDGYTKRNKSHFVIFRKDGYETIERKIGKNFPLDEYGLSLLAVQQSNKTGEFICCTSRWNHGGYGNIPTIKNADDVLSFDELKKITGVNDSDFELIFNVWKEQNDKKSNKRLEKGKENLILTDIIRTFKYCQMMIQNGSNLKQLFDNNLIDDARLLSDNNEHNTNIDKVKISKNIIALRTTKDEVSKWTICDRGILMPEQVLGDNFSSGNDDMRFRWAPEEFKDNIVVFNTKRRGSVLYSKKTHNIISINDNKYFTMTQNIGDSKYFLLFDERDACYILDSTTFKPLYTPNNENVFENVTYYKICNILKMVYDSSAKSIYYYNLNNNSFIDKIYGTEVPYSMAAENIEKKGILPLIKFVPSMDYHTMYQTQFFDIEKNEYLKDTNGEIVSYANFVFLGDCEYGTASCEHGRYIVKIDTSEKLKYPNGETIICENASYVNSFYDDNPRFMSYKVKDDDERYNFISITIKWGQKYCFYDLYTNKFFINEDGSIFFKEYGQGKVYNKYKAIVKLPMTADGPYWYQTDKNYDIEDVNQLLESGINPKQIFDDIQNTKNYITNGDGETISQNYSIVKLNSVYNLLSYEGNYPHVISQQWFRKIEPISDGMCVVVTLGGDNVSDKFNYLKLDGGLLLDNDKYTRAQSFNPYTHLAIVSNYKGFNLINKNGEEILSKNAEELKEFYYEGEYLYKILYPRQRFFRYLTPDGEIFKNEDDAVKHIRTKRIENTKKQEDKELDYVVEQVLNETATLFNTFNKQSNIIFNKKLLENINSNELKDVINTFETQDELNAKFWVDGKLNSRVRLRLLDIADKFIDSLNVSWIKPTDIIMTGSLCNYNWSKYSDIDLHILIDFKKVHERNDFVKEYFDSKRKLWNDTHDNLMIYGFPVELYVQDTNEEHISSAIYSLEKNEWIIEPTKNKFEVLNKEKTWLIKKSKEIMKTIDSFEDEFSKETDEKKIDILSKKVKKLFDKIKKGRKHDLQKNGEFGLINLLFKVLRRCGYLKKLLDLKIETFDKIMSIK